MEIYIETHLTRTKCNSETANKKGAEKGWVCVRAYMFDWDRDGAGEIEVGKKNGLKHEFKFELESKINNKRERN